MRKIIKQLHGKYLIGNTKQAFKKIRKKIYLRANWCERPKYFDCVKTLGVFTSTKIRHYFYTTTFQFALRSKSKYLILKIPKNFIYSVRKFEKFDCLFGTIQVQVQIGMVALMSSSKDHLSAHSGTL